VIKQVIVRSRFAGHWGRKDPDRHHELVDTTTHVSGRSDGVPSPVRRPSVLVSQVQAGKRASAPRELSNGWSRCRRCLRRDEGRESPVRFRSRLFQPQNGAKGPSSGRSPTSRESAAPSTKGHHAPDEGASAFAGMRVRATMRRGRVERSWRKRIAAPLTRGSASANCAGPLGDSHTARRVVDSAARGATHEVHVRGIDRDARASAMDK